MPRARNIPTKLRFSIVAQPCVICGLSGLGVVDHYIPVALGGTRIPENLQPLCEQCNAKKRHRLSNAELRTWHRGRRIRHFLEHHYRLATQYNNPYDGPGFDQWLHRWLFSEGNGLRFKGGPT